MKVPEQVEEPLAEMCSVCCNVFYKTDFSLTSVDCRNAPLCFPPVLLAAGVEEERSSASCTGIQVDHMHVAAAKHGARSAFSC